MTDVAYARAIQEPKAENNSFAYRNELCFQQNQGNLYSLIPNISNPTIPELFRQITIKYSEKQAFCDYIADEKINWMTYSQLSQDVHVCISFLLDKNIESHHYVVLIVHSKYYIICALWALYHMKVTIIPTDPIKEQVDEILDRFSCQVVIGLETDSSLLVDHSTIMFHSITDELLNQADCDEKVQTNEIKPSDIAILQYDFNKKIGYLFDHETIMTSAASILSTKCSFLSATHISYQSLTDPFERSLHLLILSRGGKIYLDSHNTNYLSASFKQIKPTFLVMTSENVKNLISMIISSVEGKSLPVRLFFDFTYHILKQSNEKKLMMPWIFRTMFSSFENFFGTKIKFVLVKNGIFHTTENTFLRIVFGITFIRCFCLPETHGVCATQTWPAPINSDYGPPVISLDFCLRDIDAFIKTVKDNDCGQLLMRGNQIAHSYAVSKDDVNPVQLTNGWYETGLVARMFSNGSFFIKNTIAEYFEKHPKEVKEEQQDAT